MSQWIGSLRACTKPAPLYGLWSWTVRRSSAFPSCPFAWGSGGPAGETTLRGNFLLAVVRWSQMYLANKHYGTLNWGLTATPKYDITKNAMEYITKIKGEGGGLSDTLVSDFRMNPAFRLRPTGFNNAEGLSSLTWSNIAPLLQLVGSVQLLDAPQRRGVFDARLQRVL
jgi:hypothetical protein